jgi:DNA invertase Pin-like site-specific DNA recombinase
MSKISADHLSRVAYVYVRQSTADQLTNNPESRRRQYGLATRAQELGWTNVIVIDDDLGVRVAEQQGPGSSDYWRRSALAPPGPCSR